MYLTVKILVTLAIVILPAAVLVREWKYHDRGTTRHHRITRGILLAWCLASAGSLVLVWHESHQGSQMAMRIKDLVDGKNQLIEQNKDLLSEVQTYQADLEREKQKTRRLEMEAKRSKRGITSTYGFSGTHRSTSPGHIAIKQGAKSEAFRRIIELHDSGEWSALLKLCHKEMKSTPEWLTPFTYAGIANANLGHKERAVELLRHVQENAAGDPEYAQVNDLLQRLGAE